MDLAAELERRLAAKENRKNRRNKRDRRSMADTPDDTERKDITDSPETSGIYDMTEKPEQADPTDITAAQDIHEMSYSTGSTVTQDMSHEPDMTEKPDIQEIQDMPHRPDTSGTTDIANEPDQTDIPDDTGKAYSTDSLTEALRREVEGNIPAKGKPKKEKRHAKANTNKGRRLRIATFCAAVAVLAAVAVPFAGRLKEDADAQKLSEEVLSREELRAELQRQADGSRFRVVINTAPVSGDGKTADWCVANSASNSYDMQVIVQMEDSRELYRSGLMTPGTEELEGELMTPLDPGTYPAVAVVYAFDRETGEEAGEVTVDLTLTVGDGQPETETP